MRIRGRGALPLVALLLAGLVPALPGPPAGDPPAAAAATEPQRPSIVLVVADDLSMNLVRTMAEARRMRRRGASYRNSFVVDSTCCPSRASLLTGQYPHQTGVLTNVARLPQVPAGVGPIGGWRAFRKYGNVRRSVSHRLQDAGWTTGYVGKFLNGYEPELVSRKVPDGWSRWEPVFGDAYDGWDFRLARDRGAAWRTRRVPAPPPSASIRRKDQAYAGTVVANRALTFIRDHRDDDEPYFLVVAPYAPHPRVNPNPAYAGEPLFPPAFRDRARGGRPGNCGPVRCDRIGLSSLPGFGDSQHDNVPRRADGRIARQWRTLKPLIRRSAARGYLRTRAQMVQSIDRMLRRIRRAVGPDTYVVFTSDNGFHIGQHGLLPGKGSPFDSDVRVPLLVTGPGVRQGTRQEVVSNIDLAPTIEELAGLEPAAYRAGRSLVPTFGDRRLSRRRFTFFEHLWAAPEQDRADPRVLARSGPFVVLPTYIAVRSRSALLVRWDLDRRWRRRSHAWEFYDYRRVPWERTNGYGRKRYRERVAALTRRLRSFERCTATYRRGQPVPQRCQDLTR